MNNEELLEQLPEEFIAGIKKQQVKDAILFGVILIGMLASLASILSRTL